MNLKRRNLLAVFVVALACSQMIGYLTGAKTVSLCGAGLCLAPRAEVFSELDKEGGMGTEGGAFGLGVVETFTLEFRLHGRGADGVAYHRVLTPEMLAGVEGPHARRAVYAAAFANGDVRAGAAWERAWCFGFGPDGPLREAFTLPPDVRDLQMFVTSRTQGRDDAWPLFPDCTR